MTNEITIEILPWLSRALGSENKIVISERIRKDEVLRSVLEKLTEDYDDFENAIYDRKHGTINEGVVIFVNDRPIDQRLNTTMKIGDRMTVTPLYSGG